MTTPDLSIDVQIAAVKREIGMRSRVYPRRVADGKMQPEQAARQIAEMQAVLATLERLRDEQRPGLF